MPLVLTLVCRVVLWASGKIVPTALLEEWTAEWANDLWRWMLNAARTGERESIHALLDHTKRALISAFDARFRTELGIAEVRRIVGSPRFCLSLCAAPLVLIVIASFGLSNLRELSRGLPYPQPERVSVLAQGPPVFGVRLGFNDRELRLFTERSKTLESSASYVWRTVPFAATGSAHDVQASYVSDRFFEVLGSNFQLHHPDEFFVSDLFWRKILRGDPNAVGKTYMVAGKAARLAAVLPQDFTFLNTSIGIWLPLEADLTPQPARWWMGLKGAVARIRPEATRGQVESELHQLQVQMGLARRNFSIEATPIRNLVYSQLWSYGWNLDTALAIALIWVLGGFVLDRRKGMPARLAARYWGYFALKPILLFLALFCFLFEFTSVTALGMTGGLQSRGGPFLTWWSFIAAVIILIWAWRDQPSRCRVCLQRMRQPLRIGIPGQMLLETSGEEVLCPQGHGSVYRSESVLGSEISNQWMGFEQDVFK
jgi:hypothetical protein